MKILPTLPAAEGYIPSTPDLNQEEGILDIGQSSDCSLFEESKIIAETLILRCSLHPIAHKNRGVHVQLIAEGEGLENAYLYDEDSITYGYEGDIRNSSWQAIALNYEGIGRGVYKGEDFIFYGHQLPFGEIEVNNPIYLKPFNCETAHFQERVTTLASGQILRFPPGVLDTQVLRGYGGYFKPGLELEKIQQVYYSLTSTHRHTKVRLIPSTLLNDQQTPPPFGGQTFDYTVQFISTLKEEEYLSLLGALGAGYARLTVASQLGLTTFSSFLGEPISGFPNLVNVYFRVCSF